MNNRTEFDHDGGWRCSYNWHAQFYSNGFIQFSQNLWHYGAEKRLLSPSFHLWGKLGLQRGAACCRVLWSQFHERRLPRKVFILVNLLADWLAAYWVVRLAPWLVDNGGCDGLLHFHDRENQKTTPDSTLKHLLSSIGLMCVFGALAFYYL